MIKQVYESEICTKKVDNKLSCSYYPIFWKKYKKIQNS